MAKQAPELTWLGRVLAAMQQRLTVDKALILLCVTGAALFVADFLYKKKTYFDLEYLPG